MMPEEPTPKVYETQKDIDAAWSSGNAYFKDAVFKCDANFSLLPLNGKVDFRGAVFKGHVDFTNFEFRGKVDFSGAVFEDGASFKDARFLTRGEDVLFDGAVFLSPNNDVTFQNAQFGLPYQREFGEWQIGFKRNEDGFSFLRRMKAERPAGKIENLGDCSTDIESFIISNSMMDHSIGIRAAIGRYKEAPKDVSFRGCRFENSGIVSFTFVGFNNSGSVDFSSVRFANSDGVFFGSAHFANSGSVYFNSAYFANDGEVSFKSSKFTYNDSVIFDQVRFANRGNVSFNTVEFENRGYVSFQSSRFFNRTDVDFSFARFANGGQVWLLSAGFFNGKHVYFDSAKFINGGTLNFRQIIWANSGSLLWWRQVEFKETAMVKFDECLFLSEGAISFGDIRFPNDGSVMFQRCYFTSTQVIDFSEAVFRHTTFEGGRISWLKDQKERSLIAILKGTLKEKFDDLPQEAKDRIDKLNMKIPIISRVFKQDLEVRWKDLTAESAKNLTFRLTNLSGSIFDGMTPTHIQLNAPKWAVVQGRKGLYEEKQWREKGEVISLDQLINIGDQYTQLKNNLERQGNYLHAGEFHFAEQEIRKEILKRELKSEKDLLKKATISYSIYLSWCYKWFSGFGERPARAVGVFLGLFALLWVGVSLFDGIEGGFRPFVDVSTPFSWAKPLVKGDPLVWKWYFLGLIPGQLLLFGIQLPLMILAVRRRFKR